MSLPLPTIEPLCTSLNDLFPTNPPLSFLESILVSVIRQMNHWDVDYRISCLASIATENRTLEYFI